MQVVLKTHADKELEDKRLGIIKQGLGLMFN
jgi:hypothetical protein